MMTALPASLIFLLFTFSTQHHLTLVESTDVFDYDGNPVVPGELYHILDASDPNRLRGLEIGQLINETCPVTVIVGSNPRNVIFHHVDKPAPTIGLGEPTSIRLDEVDDCAKSAYWNVTVPGGKQYPLLIGPPDGVPALGGVFQITESNNPEGSYYISFLLEGIDEYILTATKSSDQNREVYNLLFCPSNTDRQLSVYFQRIGKPVVPSPPPPSPSPPPPSTFKPLIRKGVRYAA